METTQTQTEHPTFESVWALMQENARQLEIMCEENARQRKIRQEEQKEIERQMKENAKRLDKQIGDLGNRFGEMTEHLVAPGIAKRFNELGYHFDDISSGGHKIFDKQGKIKAEIDILLVNDESIVAVEVKTKVVRRDIEDHARRLEILREYWLKLNDRKIHGAIAGAIFGEVEKKATLEAGMYVLEQSGDTMKLEIPDGFVPRDW